MRLVLATLSFFIALAALFGAYLWLVPPDAPGWLTTFVAVVAIVLSLIITNKLVNAPGTDFWSLKRVARPVEQPDDETSLIADTTYRASRCFIVEESGEEGPQYFIELQDRTVLFLSGSYFASYEPYKFLGLINSPRKFPCAEFIVRRDRYEGGVVGIRCRGAVLEPELILPPLDDAERESVAQLKNGDVIRHRSYEELKKRFGRSAAPEQHA
jgi:hypothetical protein